MSSLSSPPSVSGSAPAPARAPAREASTRAPAVREAGLSVEAVLAVALVGAVALRLWLNMALPLADTTEARYGEIARLGLERGYWLMPHATPDLPFYAKPPASTWLSMLAGAALGVSEFALRLPSVLLLAAVAAIVHRLAMRRTGAQSWQGPLAATVVLTAPLGFVAAGAVMTDAVHLLAVTAAMACGQRLLQSGPADRARWRWAFWAVVGLGTLGKGLATVALIAVPIALYGLAVRAPWRTWRAFLAPGPVLAALALAAPWFVAAESGYPGFLRYFLVGEHLQRFLEPGWSGDRYGTAHSRPLGTIWVYAAAALGPWLAVAALRPRRADATGSADADRLRIRAWWACWTLAPLLMFTFARNIIWTYALTALPPFALWVAERAGRLDAGRARALALAACAWVGALALASPVLRDRIEANSARTLLAAADRADPGHGLPVTVPGALRFSGAYYSQGRACVAHDVASEVDCRARGPGLRVVEPAAAEADEAAARADRIVATSRFVLVRDSGATR